MSYEALFSANIRELITTIEHLPINSVVQMALEMKQILKGGGKIIAFGCGGSMADAQHFAAELVGRYVNDHNYHPAIALNDPSMMSAIANDFGWERVFSRQIIAQYTSKDAVLAISTSGHSDAVIEGAQIATTLGIPVYALTGREISTNVLARVSDLVIHVPSNVTSRIQEVHGLIIHMLCEALDEPNHTFPY